LDIEKEYPWLSYFVTTLRYIAKDFQSGDETRRKGAKKAMLDAIDKYCMEVIRTKEPIR
jgi:hypothetical protein